MLHDKKGKRGKKIKALAHQRWNVWNISTAITSGSGNLDNARADHLSTHITEHTGFISRFFSLSCVRHVFTWWPSGANALQPLVRFIMIFSKATQTGCRDDDMYRVVFFCKKYSNIYSISSDTRGLKITPSFLVSSHSLTHSHTRFILICLFIFSHSSTPRWLTNMAY